MQSVVVVFFLTIQAVVAVVNVLILRLSHFGDFIAANGRIVLTGVGSECAGGYGKQNIAPRIASSEVGQYFGIGVCFM